MTIEKNLIKLFNESRESFHKKLEAAKKRTSAISWASGPGDVADLEPEPLRSQINGMKSGKLIKAPAKPTKNKIIYHLDSSGRPTYKVLYASKPNDRWIVYVDIYEYTTESVFRYSYGSHFEDTQDSVDLQRISEITPPPPRRATLVNEINEFQQECTTTEYKYTENGEIHEITTTWIASGSKKLLTAEGSGDGLQIFWRNNAGDPVRIYPCS
jgi:hypothetical protein